MKGTITMWLLYIAQQGLGNHEPCPVRHYSLEIRHRPPGLRIPSSLCSWISHKIYQRCDKASLFAWTACLSLDVSKYIGKANTLENWTHSKEKAQVTCRPNPGKERNWTSKQEKEPPALKDIMSENMDMTHRHTLWEFNKVVDSK